MVEISPFSGDFEQRNRQAERLRIQAARRLDGIGVFPRPTNGDEERYPSRIGNFSKGLPHNDLGEVEPADYNALLRALRTGNFADFEALRIVGELNILNPLGGLVFNLEGPDSPAPEVAPPPAFASEEIAAQAAELYWMAVARDVPFADYDTDPLIAEAVDDLGDFPGYTGSTPVTPQNLFRVDYPGVLDGPMVSQFLMQRFRFDGIEIDGRTRVPLPVTTADGIDFLTSYEEWLCAQRGFPVENNPFGYPVCPRGEQVFDQPRFLRSVRDLGQNAGQDAIYSAYLRPPLILRGAEVLDQGNPYRRSRTQSGFATFGLAHLLMLVGGVHKAERHTWYQKWNVHRFLRPEVFGGRVHNVMTGAADYPIQRRLLKSPVLDRVFEYNRIVNQRRGCGGGDGSFLLPILFPNGGPSHPSFPAGHAISAGACVTVLKAWYDEDAPFPNPVKASRDGLTVEPYEVGVDGPALTVGGELNKLAHNLSFGRDMSGVHWRADDVQGNLQGEEVAIRILREARPTYPELFTAFTLRKFDGTTIAV
ncbi:MAG: vanadium-dependent haloperoxidase [Pseudonocardiaceae bacterium]